MINNVQKIRKLLFLSTLLLLLAGVKPLLAQGCARPTLVRIESMERADSVVVSWTNPDLSITSWDVAYGLAGFDPDTATTIIYGAWDTIQQLPYLQGGMLYQVFVRSDCGSAYSQWQGPVDFVPGSVRMRPAAVGAVAQTVQLCGGAIYDDGGRNGNYSIPYSSGAYSTLTVYPSANSLVTIHGTLSCYNNASYGLYIYDGAGIGGTLMGHYYGNATIPHMVSTQGPITIRFEPYTGGSAYSGFELFVGCEPMPPCSPITDVEIVRAPTAAYATWQLLNPAMGVPASYDLELVDSTGNIQSVSTMEREARFDNLGINEPYLLRVQPMCYDGSFLDWDTILFSTKELICSQINTNDTISVGNGTNTTSAIPVNNNYNYSFSEQMIMASEFDTGACDVVGIGFQYAYSSPTTAKNNVRIYMGHTTASSLTGYLPLSSQTLVYSGPLNARNGWNYYLFNEAPFHYNGRNHVVVTVEDLSGSYNGSAYTFYGHSTSGRAVNYYSSSAMSGVPSSRYTSSNRNNMQFLKCGITTTCGTPQVVVRSLSHNSADLLWLPGYNESSWDVSYRASGDPSWITLSTSTTSTSTTLTGLSPNTRYDVRVSHTCQGVTYNGTAQFTTTCTPATLPFSESFETWGTSGSTAAPACWRKIYNTTSTSYMPYSSTSYAYDGSRSLYLGSLQGNFSGIVLPVLAAPLDSLTLAFSLYRPDTLYDHGVLVGVISDPDNFSTFRILHSVAAPHKGWYQYELPLTAAAGMEGRLAIVTPQTLRSTPYIDGIEVDYYHACQRPAITNTYATADSIYLSWNGSTTLNYEVEYGPHGFAHGNGSTRQVYMDTSYAISGLLAATTYDLYVRTLCSSGETSNWSYLATVTTQCGAMTLPIEENFDRWGTATGTTPRCWHCATYDGTGYQTGYPSIAQLNGGGRTSPALYFRSSGTNIRPFAMMPAADFSLISLNQCEVTFDMIDMGSTTGASHLVVGISSLLGDFTSFTPIDTITAAATGTLATHTVPFYTYYGSGEYVTFYTYTTGSGTPSCAIYIDTVSLGRSTTCGRADSLYCNSTSATSATVGWRSSSSAYLWAVQYQAVGSATTTTVLATSNPYTLQGLQPATDYTFNVRSICINGDTSYFAWTPGSFTTLQIPATLPYRCDFENSTESQNWQTITNTDINWYRGTATYASPSHSLYVSADGGVSNSTRAGTVNATAYRDIDFGPADTNVVLRFKVRVGGSANGNYDGVGLFLEDPATPLVTGNSLLLSPWGSLTGNHTCREILHMDTLWTEHTYYFDTVQGTHRLGFYWYNQSMNTGTTGQFIGPPGAIDDIRVNYNTCHQPTGLALGSVGSTSASATWNTAAGARYIFEYEVLGSNNPTSVALNSGSYTMQQLRSGTTYRCRVRRSCTGDTSGWTDYRYFNTDLCAATHYDSLSGPGTSTISNTYPISMTNAYSFTEMLYLASELSGPANVGQIQFSLASAKPLLSRTNCTIYMGHTWRRSLAHSGIYVPADSLRMVYCGPIAFAHGWSCVVLDSQFVYNGFDNLIVAVDDNTGTISGQSNRFDATQRSTSMTVQFFHDGYNPDPYNLGSYAGQSNGSSVRPNIVLGSCGTPCAAPALNNPAVTHEQALLSWRANGNSFEFACKLSTDSDWPASTTLTDTFTTVASLSALTSYDYRVRQACGSGAYSEWRYGSFTTNDAPCLQPTNVRRFGSTRTTITVAWERGGTENLWVARLSNNNYSSIDTVDALMTTFSGLQSGQSYNIMVRSLCLRHGDTVAGDWTEPVSVATSVCKPVTDLQLRRATDTSATIGWTRGSNNTGNWEVEYGPHGYTAGNGTAVTTTDNPTTISGLTAGYNLDFYVRAICDTDYVSTWSDPLHVNRGSNYTDPADANAPQVAIVPNPANESTTVAIANIDGELTLTLHDINGRTVSSIVLQCAGNCQQQLDLGHLAAGTYFVRITTATATHTRKLIISE